MKKSFRTKIYTRRITNISKAGIEKLRKTQLEKTNPKDYKRIKFLKSSSFDTRVRQNIRENRFSKNVKSIKEISKSIGNTKERQKVIRRLFGEVTTHRNGKRVTYNSFTSVKQTQRLDRIKRQIKSGNFNIKRYVTRTQEFKNVKKYLPTNASIGEVLTALDRTNFYFENKELIQQHNRNVVKHGRLKAEEMSTGERLSNEYVKSLNEEDADLISDMF